MPLPLRTVEPTYVSRGTLPERFPVQNDLEAVANGTLSNVILQLSSLSHHAEELFTDLINVGTEIATRASNLQIRIDRLAVKVLSLDGMQEESSMQEALNTKPFQSAMAFDQQVVSRLTLPPGMTKTYISCDKPPPLDKLNSYRDDGKDGLKFYTDPSYFFDLWRQEMLKDTERRAIRKPHKPKGEGGVRHKKRVRQPNLTRERQKNLAIEHGEHIMPGTEIRQHPNTKVIDVGDGQIYPPPDQNQFPNQNRPSRQLSIESKQNNYRQNNYNDGPIQGYNETTNGIDANENSARHYQFANHNHYDQYETYLQQQQQQQQQQSQYQSNNNNIHQQQRYNYSPHMTPPPSYSAIIMDNTNGGSPNASYLSRVHSNSRSSMNSSPAANSNNMTNGFAFAFRPSQPPPAPPPPQLGMAQSGGTPTKGKNNNGSGGNSRETLPPPPPPPVEIENGGGKISSYNHYPPPPVDEDEPLPPPPPTPDQYGVDGMMHIRPPSIPEEINPPSPPPPPPNDVSDAAPPPPPALPATSQQQQLIAKAVNGGLKKTKKSAPPPQAFDGHSELLEAIRNGIELRKVDKKKESGREEKSGSTLCDVASILARRVAVEMSDSESGSGESEYDSDGWDETNN